MRAIFNSPVCTLTRQTSFLRSRVGSGTTACPFSIPHSGQTSRFVIRRSTHFAHLRRGPSTRTTARRARQERYQYRDGPPWRRRPFANAIIPATRIWPWEPRIERSSDVSSETWRNTGCTESSVGNIISSCPSNAHITCSGRARVPPVARTKGPLPRACGGWPPPNAGASCPHGQEFRCAEWRYSAVNHTEPSLPPPTYHTEACRRHFHTQAPRPARVASRRNIAFHRTRA
jgi:hypothetical protein